ncbi:LapA family protein, partial [Bacillus sp. LR--39]
KQEDTHLADQTDTQDASAMIEKKD